MMKKGLATSNINKGRKSFYCSNKCVNERIHFPKPCPVCATETKPPNKYCSRVCSGKHIGHIGGKASATETNRKNTSERMKRVLADETQNVKYLSFLTNQQRLERYSASPRTCKECKTTLPYDRRIRKTCGSEQCLKSAYAKGHANKKVTTRSRDEIELYNLCATEWVVEANPVLFDGYDADIVIRNKNVAVMWDGPWHYREMPGLKHSLKQIQNRDAYKDRKLIESGWTVIHYRDDQWTPESAFADLQNILNGGASGSMILS